MKLTSYDLEVEFTEGDFDIDLPDGSMALFNPTVMHFKSPSEHSVEG